ncbi:anti-sigma-K factor RskA [Antricoccus suffuscus]|uniref:Regulator of SigK n=1 Tax=Antricoccus suffuscus TaxID=1629062 RepID=A0A2T1A679_9ACTN|nr:anti-sigma factor [Antricoccus suffuscus]PRZ44064.1 anti-sigma-K factor RskA [Antricoccus suffuscus]
MPDLHDFTGAYVVDALDEDERASFEAHLENCPDCVAEVRSLRDALGELSDSTAVAPPPELRASVLGAITHEAQPQSVTQEPSLPDNVTPLRARPSRRWLWPATAAACAVIAIGGTGWGFAQHRDATKNADRISAITTVLGGSDTVTVSGPIGSSGNASIVYSKAEQKLLLIGNDIPAPPDHKTYQLWMISPQGAATSAGTFAPDSGGHVLLQASGDVAGTAQMGISVEPAGGSAQPTKGAILAVMPL